MSAVAEANAYWSERYADIVCHCSVCGGEIYGNGGKYEADEYWLDEDGNTVHMEWGCVARHIREKGQSQGGARF